jgi:hypothetical protein
MGQKQTITETKKTDTQLRRSLQLTRSTVPLKHCHDDSHQSSHRTKANRSQQDAWLFATEMDVAYPVDFANCTDSQVVACVRADLLYCRWWFCHVDDLCVVRMQERRRQK